MSDPYQVVRDFEKAICEYTYAPYAVAVESCSAALFLSFLYYKVDNAKPVFVPARTYPSVPCAIINAGGQVKFRDDDWQQKGWYRMSVDDKYEIFYVVDSAKYFKWGMWSELKEGHKRTLVCLSFHGKKHLKIGRGGMILTDSKHAYEILRLMRFDGRHEATLPTDKLAGIGWNMYMTPEQASRGLEQLQWIGDGGVLPSEPYQDLSKYKFYTKANR